MFSARTDWHRQPNTLTRLLDERRKLGLPITDLTIANPTEAGFTYPADGITAALAHQGVLTYEPEPLGLLSARNAIAAYYSSCGTTVDPSRIILTASTSEAYGHLFGVLCEPGESILVPKPSYPLFEYLAQLHNVHVDYYHLRYDGEWHIDLDSIRSNITGNTKALVLVHPHNPTGMFVKREEAEAIRRMVAEKSLALIVDEVFEEYAFESLPRRAVSFATESDALTFTLNGISKSCGLPQLKLGWIVVSGNNEMRLEALRRLEVVCDTYLSVNTPVQLALDTLLEAGAGVRVQIQERTRKNYNTLRCLCNGTAVSVLNIEGGWYAILRMPSVHSDEEWAARLLQNAGVYVFPGYYFEMAEGSHVVVSLLAPSADLEKGIAALLSSIK